MPSGYQSAGADFDALFDPDVVGDGPAAAGYTVAGAPLKYAAMKYGTKRANVGYAVNGSDVSNLWAAKGTAGYLDGAPGYQWSTFRAFAGTGSQTVQSTLTWSPDGTWANTSPGTATKSGTWAPSSPSPGAMYQMMIDTVVLSAAAGHTLTLAANPAASWVDMTSSIACVMQDIGPPSSNESGYSARLRIRLKSTGAVMYTGTISGAITIANV